MVNIVVKIIGLGVNCDGQGLLFLRDAENNLLCVEKTYNGMVNFSLTSNCLYKLLVISKQGRKNISFYVDKKRKCYYFGLFDNVLKRKITFQLTDANYENLPIEKGEIILWVK